MTSTSTSLRIALLLTLSNAFLDPYTYLCRGGVFSTTQTANVVFFAAGLASQHWSAAVAKLWPILAFMVGVALATGRDARQEVSGCGIDRIEQGAVIGLDGLAIDEG